MADNSFVVFDTDMGTDDAWALLMMIKAETVLNLFKILAITTVMGNTYVRNATENTMRMLESANRTDIPVYIGNWESFLPINASDSFFYGLDGFGDVLPSNPGILESLPKEHAVNVMYELASKHPHKVSFVVAGPLTNLAACIKMHEDFLDKVKDIWIFGGDLHYNRRTDEDPEFNIYSDRLASNIVLQNANVPVYMVPLEPCDEVNKDIDLPFRFDYLGSVDSAPIHLLNTVEREIFIPKGNWHLYDPYMTAAFVFRDEVIVKSRKYHGHVDVCGEREGVLQLDQKGEKNVFMVEKFDTDSYKKIIAWTAGVPGVEFKKPCNKKSNKMNKCVQN